MSHQLQSNESIPSKKKKIIVLGSGPNRIGQGIEFDYCCVHGLLAVKESGYEAIMVNCNPETVSTDFDMADKLYFEPVFWEHLWEIIELEQPEGVIVQLGGQTALKLAKRLTERGIKIIGTSFDSLDIAEDRGRFSDLLKELNIPYPEYGTAYTAEEAIEVANKVGYPVLVRPSYVIGGQRMRIVINDAEVESSVVSILKHIPDNKILIDHFLDRCQEAEVDAIFDGETFHVMGVMEHIEPAGIHSGDSNAVLPAFNLTPLIVATMEFYSEKIARALNIKGLINIQFAIKDDKVYVIEANPRASRTVPFVSKATGVPLAKAAARIALGSSIASLREEGLLPAQGEAIAKGISVKEAVLPWNRFRRVDGRGVDAVLGPEMRSTGEVMGIASSFGAAYAKSQISSFGPLPKTGTVFISLADKDRSSGIAPAKGLVQLGFHLIATDGTSAFLREHGIETVPVRKNSQGTGPMGEKTIVEMLNAGDISLVINTPVGRGTRADGWAIRTASVQRSIPIITTTAGFSAAVEGIKSLQANELSVAPIQEWLAR